MAATLGKRTFSELFAEDEPADVGYFVDDKNTFTFAEEEMYSLTKKRATRSNP